MEVCRFRKEADRLLLFLLPISLNMKHVFLFLNFSLLFAAGSMAQSRIFIPINNQDCINCLGSIHYLGMLDTTYPSSLVFQKRYRRDSVALIKRLHLEPFRNQLLWSDSLYNVFSSNGKFSSAVSVYNPENGNILKTSLVHIADNLPFLNAINDPIDTITLEHSTFGSEANFGNTGRVFYNFNGITKQMEVYGKTDSKYYYTLSMNDSLVKVAFKLRFGREWEDKYSKIKDYTSKWQTIDPQAYNFYWCNDDMIYLLAEHNYLIYPEEGAPGITTCVFLSLSEYKNGELVRFSLIDNYLDALMKGKEGGIARITEGRQPVQDKEARYTLSGTFLAYNNELYLQVMGDLSVGIPNHFLARYYYDAKDRTYKFRSLYDRSLPAQYDSVGYNILNPLSRLLFSAPYTSLCLSDRLYSLDEGNPDIVPDVFAPQNRYATGRTLWDIKVNPTYIYSVYLSRKEQSYHYQKYDRKQKKVVMDKVICKYTDLNYITSPMLDDFDYNYIYQPIGESTIVRKRMTD